MPAHPGLQRHQLYEDQRPDQAQEAGEAGRRAAERIGQGGKTTPTGYAAGLARRVFSAGLSIPASGRSPRELGPGCGKNREKVPDLQSLRDLVRDDGARSWGQGIAFGIRRWRGFFQGMARIRPYFVAFAETCATNPGRLARRRAAGARSAGNSRMKRKIQQTIKSGCL